MITALDVVALGGYLLAGGALLVRRRAMSGEPWWMLAVVVATSIAFEATAIVEKFGVTAALDPVEDVLRVMQPLVFGGLVYAYQQRASQRALARREALLGAALDGGRLGAWEWDIARDRVVWFGLTERIFGLEPGVFDNRVETVRERVHPDDRDSMWADVERALDGEAPYESSYRVRLPDGAVRWVEATGVVHRGAGGVAQRLVGTVRDVTAEREATLQRHAAEQRLLAQKRFVDRAIDSLPGVFYLFDESGRFERWNNNFETVTGYTSDEIAAMHPLDFFGAEERDLITQRIARVFEHGTSTVEADFVSKDGTRRRYYFTGHRVEFEGRVCLVGMGIDVAEWKAAEAALRESEARYRALYDDNPTTYVTLDASGVIRSVNAYGASQLGHDVADLIGVDARTLYPEAQRPELERFLAECLVEPGTLHRWELPKLRADGSTLWVRETARAVHDEAGRTVILVVSEDVSEARDLSERLAFEATHDGLTGLVNRREFEKRLARCIETAREDGVEHALCYLDLDQFKVVNDTCGHVAGDHLLRQLGAVLGENVRRRDTLARLGGDEFALLIEHCPLAQALGIAESIRQSVDAYRFQWEDYGFKVGASVGVVPIDAASPSAAHVLGMADNACYVAKEQGRNRVHVYREDDAEIARRSGEIHWVARLDEALERGRFTLVRQPIRALAAPEQGAHYELLLRMLDSDGALISPGAFLPAAERYNVAVRIDRWVLDTALGWLAASPEEQAALSLCAINLSAQSLGDETFLEHVTERIRASRVPPSKLCFEITETAAIVNLPSAHAFIAALRDLGCQFALDDFGSGLSSFGYLKTLPVDFLKIDGAFVKDIVSDPIDLAMVEAINGIGQVIGKRTIAEFVESEAVLEKLRAIGVDFVQGYHVGHPEPIPWPPQSPALSQPPGAGG